MLFLACTLMLAKEKPLRPCHPGGLFLCYSSREARPTGPALLLLALGGQVGGGGGVREGAALPCPARAAAATCSSCGPRCRQPRPEARPVLLQQRAAAAGRSAEGRSSSLAAAARSPWPLAAAGLCRAIAYNRRVIRGLATRITSVICPLASASGDTIALLAAAIRCGSRLRPCLISSHPAAVCGVRRHRRQDAASAAGSR